MKLRSTFLILLMFISPACSSADTGGDIKNLTSELESYIKNELQSKDSSDIAWGAYLARKYDQKSLVPNILSAAKNVAIKGDTSFLLLSIFDALIYFDETPDINLLLNFAQQYPIVKNDVIILLVQDAFRDNDKYSNSKERDTKKTFTISKLESTLASHNENYVEWFAIANALAENKSPNFATNLLRELHIELNVYIDSPKKQSSLSGRATSKASDGFIQVPPNFPPTVTYELATADSASTKSVLFSPGINPVAYTRSESTDSMIGIGTSQIRGGVDEQRVKYLMNLSENPAIQVSSFYELNVKWKNLATYKQEIAQEKQKIDQAYTTLLQSLAKARRISSADATNLKPKITVHPLDFRADKTIPID